MTKPVSGSAAWPSRDSPWTHVWPRPTGVVGRSSVAVVATLAGLGSRRQNVLLPQ